MCGKTIARSLVAVLSGLALGGAIVLVVIPRLFAPWLGPLPPPPAIAADRGETPAGIVAFEERVDGVLAGSGFFLTQPNDGVIGVTTAHSLGEGGFSSIAFMVAGRAESVATFTRRAATIGQPRTGADMTIDYVLLRPESPPDRAMVLWPDPRGAPQPGERVSLYSGLGDGQGSQAVFQGTVESADENGVWVRMDEVFNPGLMSGSPVISQHTGRVVGMVIMMHWLPGMLRLGVNPVGAILDAASR
jgi:hypothetical protein